MATKTLSKVTKKAAAKKANGRAPVKVADSTAITFKAAREK